MKNRLNFIQYINGGFHNHISMTYMINIFTLVFGVLNTKLSEVIMDRAIHIVIS